MSIVVHSDPTTNAVLQLPAGRLFWVGWKMTPGKHNLCEKLSSNNYIIKSCWTGDRPNPTIRSIVARYFGNENTIVTFVSEEESDRLHMMLLMCPERIRAYCIGEIDHV